MSISSNKSTGVTEDQVNTQVDNALNTAIPGSNTTDSVNDILLDKLEPRLPTGGTISTLTTGNIETYSDAGCDVALNTAIPGGANDDSINERIATMDGLIYTMNSRITGTVSTLTAANIETEAEDGCDLALDNAVTVAGTTTNSVANRVASIHDRQKMKWQWAASYILLGSAGSSGVHAVVDLDSKEGFLSCVDLFVDSGTAGSQADSAFTLNVELNDTASTAVSLCASGLFNTYWKANRMWSATVAQNAAGVADAVRFPINLPFTSTTDALKVYINLTAGSGGGAVFLIVNYGELI